MPKEEFQNKLRELMTILLTKVMTEEEKEELKKEIENLKETYKHYQYVAIEEQKKRGK